MRKAMLSALTLALGVTAMTPSVFAEDYRYMDKEVSINLDETTISVKSCVATNTSESGETENFKCDTESVKVDELKKLLAGRVASYQALLDDEDATIAKAKTLIDDDKASSFVNQRTGEEFVLLTLEEGLNLPFKKKNVEAGDFSLAFVAIKANIERYKSVLEVLGSGELPESAEFKSIAESRLVSDIDNVVIMHKHI